MREASNTKEQHGSETTRVAVAGTGVIGASWAAYFLAQGLALTLRDDRLF